MSHESQLRLLLVEDEELVLAAFGLLVQQLEGVTLVGMASSGIESVGMAAKLRPDVILMDLRMPGMDGIETTGTIKAALPGVKVIAVTALDDPLLIVKALEAGMDGILLKKASPQELKLALNTVISGEQYLSPAVIAIIAQAYQDERNRKRMPQPRLTSREQQVIQQIAEGMRFKQIAEKLGISERTAEKHCEQARHKLKAATTAEAVACWLRLQQEA